MLLCKLIVALVALLAVAYAATEPLDLEAEATSITQEHSREKRGLLLAKKALLGALLVKKGLIVGAGAGLVGAGLGAALYKHKSGYGSGYGYGGSSGGYHNGYHHGTYIYPSIGYGGYNHGYSGYGGGNSGWSSGNSGWNNGNSGWSNGNAGYIRPHATYGQPSYYHSNAW